MNSSYYVLCLEGKGGNVTACGPKLYWGGEFTIGSFALFHNALRAAKGERLYTLAKRFPSEQSTRGAVVSVRSYDAFNDYWVARDALWTAREHGRDPVLIDRAVAILEEWWDEDSGGDDEV